MTNLITEKRLAVLEAQKALNTAQAELREAQLQAQIDALVAEETPVVEGGV